MPVRQRTFILLIALLFFGTFAPAQEPKRIHIDLSPEVGMDFAGLSLRDALNAYEADLNSPVPIAWTRLRMVTGETVRFGRDLFVVKPEIVRNDPMRVMVVGPDGPAEGSLVQGKEIVIGPLMFVLISSASDGNYIDALVKGAYPTPVLLELENHESPNLIRGSETPRKIIVTSSDERILDFSEDYIQGLNKGLAPEEAAIAARQRTPPIYTELHQQSPPEGSEYVDAVNILQGPDFDEPLGATVSIFIVAGDSFAFRELNSRLKYNSNGRSPENPRVGAGFGPGGGVVRVGSPGDKFQSAVHSIGGRHQIAIQSESTIYVPFGGYTDLDLNTRQGYLSASLAARRVGRNSIEVEIHKDSGNWGYYGGVSSRIRLRDGQTLPLASNTSTMTSSSQSGAPILQDIPYAGPMFGSSRSATAASQYCIYITATLQ